MQVYEKKDLCSSPISLSYTYVVDMLESHSATCIWMNKPSWDKWEWKNKVKGWVWLHISVTTSETDGKVIPGIKQSWSLFWSSLVYD